MSDSPRRRRRSRQPEPSHPLEALRTHLERQRANRRKPSQRDRREAPPSLATPLAQTLKELRLTSKVRARRLHAAWAHAVEALEPGVLSRTRIRRLADGILTVELDSPARATEYQRFHKAFLLAELNRKLAGKPHIVELRFVVGAFEQKGGR